MRVIRSLPKGTAYDEMNSPVGTLTVITSVDGLYAILWDVDCKSLILKIPYGTTISYAEQAEKIGNKNKVRAVGMANGQNPVPNVIPCHRVIGSKGHLVGFDGGLEKKTYLLNLEKIKQAIK